MGIVDFSATSTALAPSPTFFEPNWYAVYTCANREKRVAAEIAARGTEQFLPVYQSLRRWNDRRVELDLPLFPGYVFARFVLRDRLCVLSIPGVVRLVGFGGLPIALPAEQIDALRSGLNRQSTAEPHSYLIVGRRVRIIRGAFQGAEGVLVRKKGRLRVVISLELIMRAFAVEIDANDVMALDLQESKQ